MDRKFEMRFLNSLFHNPKSKTCTELSRSIRNLVRHEGISCKGKGLKRRHAMKSAKLIVMLAILALVSAAAVPAQEKAPEKLGEVVFPTSCDAKVQPSFERAVALLHSFSWQEGEKAFRDVLERDPNCAI